VAVSCKHSNEPSGFIKNEKFLEQLSDYKLLKDSVSWSCHEI